MLNSTDNSFDSIAEHAQDFIDYFLFVVFGVLGVTFIVIGRYLKYSLRLYNEDVEHMFRRKINFSMIVLAVPFMIRSLYILIIKIVDMDDKMQNSIKDDTSLAPLMTFFVILISDIVPITAQLTSMLVVVDKRDYNLQASTVSEKDLTYTEEMIYTDDDLYESITEPPKDNLSYKNLNSENNDSRANHSSRHCSKDTIVFSKTPSSLHLTTVLMNKPKECSDSSESD